MSPQNHLDAVPDWARASLKQTDHDEIVRIFNEALHVIGLCQRKLKIRQVISIMSALGGLNVAILGDASGDRNPRYATLSWDSSQQVVHGKIPNPESN